MRFLLLSLTSLLFVDSSHAIQCHNLIYPFTDGTHFRSIQTPLTVKMNDGSILEFGATGSQQKIKVKRSTNEGPLLPVRAISAKRIGAWYDVAIDVTGYMISPGRNSVYLVDANKQIYATNADLKFAKFKILSDAEYLRVITEIELGTQDVHKAGFKFAVEGQNFASSLENGFLNDKIYESFTLTFSEDLKSIRVDHSGFRGQYTPVGHFLIQPVEFAQGLLAYREHQGQIYFLTRDQRKFVGTKSKLLSDLREID